MIDLLIKIAVAALVVFLGFILVDAIVSLVGFGAGAISTIVKIILVLVAIAYLFRTRLGL